MKISADAGKVADASKLVNVPKLVTAYKHLPQVRSDPRTVGFQSVVFLGEDEDDAGQNYSLQCPSKG
jgi:hypothetical protein